MTTAAELIEFLMTLPADTEVSVVKPGAYCEAIEVDLELPEAMDISESFFLPSTSTIEFFPEREAWVYEPTEDAAARGMTRREHPYTPAKLVLGYTD